MTLTFGTKAWNLQQVRCAGAGLLVKEFKVVTYAVWRESAARVLTEIADQFAGRTVIARSSARGEDTQESSQAGAFLSQPNLIPSDHNLILTAIQRVFDSYGNPHEDDEVMVQEQVQDIRCCGVILTRELDQLAPYFVINYDRSGANDAVTSGNGRHIETWVQFRDTPVTSAHTQIRRLIEMARQLETLFSSDRLDIEFAFDATDALYVLQVRPIVTRNRHCPVSDAGVAEMLFQIESKIHKLDAPHPRLRGKKAVFSVMTDWNPAEIIGIKPGTLALTLYKEVITDSIWAYQRDNYGYRNLRSFPLLVSFMGFPYIDVRASLNSFVPKELDDDLAARLIDYYIDALCSCPTDHDKVEFKVVFSCYDLTLPRRLQKLRSFGFSELDLDRIKFGLLMLTNRILDAKDGLYLRDEERVHQLEARYTEITGSELSLIDKIYWLIEDCKRYGTLPFAGLARAGFIAVQFLRSFVELGIISDEDLGAFMGSLETVTRRLSRDFASYANGGISREEILRRYGHLRPGTYDILSRRYDEAFDIYLAPPLPRDPVQLPAQNFSFSNEQMTRIDSALRENGLRTNAKDLIDMIRRAIEGREYSKFVFTKSISQALVLIEDLGKRTGIERHELAHLDIRAVLELYARLEPCLVRDVLTENIRRNREHGQKSSALKLPHFISSPRDIYGFSGDVEPNFITKRRVTSPVVREEALMQEGLAGKVVFIESADPGYDWLFTHQIAGLVTMFGGSNSHMAIRCSELQIPAVIGCGEGNFKQWSSGTLLDIDCANRQVIVIG